MHVRPDYWRERCEVYIRPRQCNCLLIDLAENAMKNTSVGRECDEKHRLWGGSGTSLHRLMFSGSDKYQETNKHSLKSLGLDKFLLICQEENSSTWCFYLVPFFSVSVKNLPVMPAFFFVFLCFSS